MIEFKDFCFWYPDIPTPALDNISLTIPDGQKVLILGPSGCGKSTFLLAINGVVPQLTGGNVKGRVYVDQMDIRHTPVAQLASSVGLILQDPESQLTNLYVFDEVAFGPENLNLPEEEIRQRVNLALEKVGIANLRDSSVFALSGGQKQRVAIAASLAMLPKIMLLDNPTSNLDPVGANETYVTIRELALHDNISTIILADHRPDEIIDMVDRLLIMHQGKIILDGKPRDILNEHCHFLKDELGIFLPQVAELGLGLKAAGWKIHPVPLTIQEAEDQLAKISFAPSQVPPTPHSGPGKEPSTAEVIRVEHVKYAYPHGPLVINDISLCIHQGEFVCLVGKNGSGKTTLAKMIVALLKPLSGAVYLDGADIRSILLRDLIGSVGYVFQYPEHQFVAQNVYDEVAFSLRAKQVPEDEVKQRVEEALELFSLQELHAASPLTLSKGQKRRLSVATMLVTRPRLLILDEPMTGQDQKNIHSLLAILNRLRQEGTTIIEITHDMDHVASYADRVIGMSSGKLVFDGKPSELFARTDLLEELSLEAPPPVLLANFLRTRGLTMPDTINTVDRFVHFVNTCYQSVTVSNGSEAL